MKAFHTLGLLPQRAASVFFVLAAVWAPTAHAVPSYARQTGQDCAACHVGAYGPQLTPFGMRFKIGGYTDSDGKGGKVPLSGMLTADYIRYKDDEGKTTSKSTLSEASIFLAGRLMDKVGSFTQVTYNNVDHATALDQLDLRYADTVSLYGQEAVVGLSLNNNPTVQDPLNTVGSWGFPFYSSERSNTIGADFSGLGSSEQKGLGLSAYGFLDNRWYGELGLYNTLSPAVQSRLGWPRADARAFGRMRNAAYYRLAYIRDLKTQAWSVGLLGFDGKRTDGREADDSGVLAPTFNSQRFHDAGIDASYQFLGTRKHVFTLSGSYMQERLRTEPADGSDRQRSTIKDYRLTGSYFFRSTYGATVGLFRSTTTDEAAGSANSGVIYQLDWTPFGKEDSWMAPWANLRVGLQYVDYRRYIDAGTVSDHAHDRNTLTLFAWGSF